MGGLMWMIAVAAVVVWGVALAIAVRLALGKNTAVLGITMLTGGAAGLIYLAFRLLYAMVMRYSAW